MRSGEPLAFRAFKYAVYLLLSVNVAYFFYESAAAAEYVFREGVSPAEMIVAFSAPVDSMAWLVLLLLLEVETAVLEDRISPRSKRIIAVATAICYAVILYSFYGYIKTLEVPAGFSTYDGPSPCARAGEGASIAIDLERFEPLTSTNCASLGAGALHNAALDIFASADAFAMLRRLAWLDVANSGLWLIVVTALEAEVRLKASPSFGTKAYAAFKAAKGALYAALFLVAADWARLGSPWDAWDAFLWLAAFFFIELNLFSWQKDRAALRGTVSSR
ncbi:MAG: hypothetical protein AAFX08_11260 [Pseudomonadota bacterium]